MRKLNLFTIILAILFVIGLISALISNFSKIIIPVIIFGLLYFFYKYPRGFRGKFRKQPKNNSSTIIDGKFKEINKDK
jgi:predicted membrane protein